MAKWTVATMLAREALRSRSVARSLLPRSKVRRALGCKSQLDGQALAPPWLLPARLRDCRENPGRCRCPSDSDESRLISKLHLLPHRLNIESALLRSIPLHLSPLFVTQF